MSKQDIDFNKNEDGMRQSVDALRHKLRRSRKAVAKERRQATRAGKTARP
jgi:hypothetical protein